MPGLSAVAVADVPNAISQRWRAMIDKLGRHQAHASAMTLIVSVEDETDNRTALGVVNELTGKYPLRAITVGRTRTLDDKVVAWVNAACDGDEAVPICSEEIVLQGGLVSSDTIVSAVRGLLVSDLPVILWWRGDNPRDSVLWKGLYALSDRVIVDSIRFGDGTAALGLLRELVREGGNRISVRDLNWQRTAPWRKAIATCFDDREVLSMLPGLDRCFITFASDGDQDPPSARALLMAGWLVSRYPQLSPNWHIAPGKRANVAPGRVVDITLGSSASHASLVLIRQYSPLGVEVQANDKSGKQMRRWNFRASTLSEAELLDACLETLGRDSIFESALM